jgi:hypothetical protein
LPRLSVFGHFNVMKSDTFAKQIVQIHRKKGAFGWPNA